MSIGKIISHRLNDPRRKHDKQQREKYICQAFAFLDCKQIDAEEETLESTDGGGDEEDLEVGFHSNKSCYILEVNLYTSVPY